MLLLSLGRTRQGCARALIYAIDLLPQKRLEISSCVKVSFHSRV